MQALSLRLHEFLKVVLRKTLIPVLHVILYLWQVSKLRERLVQPIAILLLFFFLSIRDLVRKEKEVYHPAQVAIDLAKNEQAL